MPASQTTKAAPALADSDLCVIDQAGSSINHENNVAATNSQALPNALAFPLKCGRINIDAIARDRDQLWAEAVRLYHSGVPWWLNATENAQAAEEQEARRDADAWEPTIEQFVDGKSIVTLSECRAHLGVLEKDWTPVDQNRVVACLTALRWKRGWRKRPDNGNERCYRPARARTMLPRSKVLSVLSVLSPQPVTPQGRTTPTTGTTHISIYEKRCSEICRTTVDRCCPVVRPPRLRPLACGGRP